MDYSKLAFNDQQAVKQIDFYKGTEASIVKQYGYFRHPAKFPTTACCSKINDGCTPVSVLLSTSNMHPRLNFCISGIATTFSNLTVCCK